MWLQMFSGAFTRQAFWTMLFSSGAGVWFYIASIFMMPVYFPQFAPVTWIFWFLQRPGRKPEWMFRNSSKIWDSFQDFGAGQVS